MIRLLGLLTVVAALTVSAQQPQPRQPQQPQQPQPGGQPTQPPPSSPSGSSTSQQDRRPGPGELEYSRPIFLTGRILMADGSPLPDAVKVECNCAGVHGASVDTSGRFNIVIGSFQRMPQPTLISCQIRAVLAGYRSDIIPLAGVRPLDNPDVGTIYLHNLNPSNELTTSATTLFAPKEAKHAYDKAAAAAQQKKWTAAEKDYRRAIDLYPRYAIAWHGLGRVYENESKTDEAVAAFNRALEADGKYVEPYRNLARIAFKQQKWDDAARFSAAFVKMNPNAGADLYLMSGIAHLKLKQLDIAEAHTREAVKAQPPAPGAYYVLATVLLQKQDLKGAAENLTSYLKAAPDAANAPQARAELAAVERRLATQP